MITCISSMATRQMLADLAANYERLTEEHVTIESVGGVAASKRIQDGETFDLVVLASDAIDRLAMSDRVDPASRTGLARSGVAVAVASGASRPAIDNEAAVRDAILAARSIGYSTGPSGAHLVRLFERWGIAGTVTPRIVLAPPGVPVGALIASGEVELGFQQSSELIHVYGIDVIGPLPDEIQLTTLFSAALCTASKQPQRARSFLAFLASTEADAAKRAQGMEPA